MFITRKQYEKNIRKSIYETANILREESDRRCRAVEKDIARIKKELAIEYSFN